MIIKNGNKQKLFIGLYFVIASIGLIFDLLSGGSAFYNFKPLLSVSLMALYWKTSEQRNAVFFAILFFLLVSNLIFVLNEEKLMTYAIITMFIYEVLIIGYIIRLIKLKDYVPCLIALTPFLFIFFYLFSEATGIPESNYNYLILQNILTSIIGAITFSNFALNNYYKNTWILLFGLLFVTLYFLKFIEKYYLYGVALSVFRISQTILYIAVYFMFYKFVIEMETSEETSQLDDN